MRAIAAAFHDSHVQKQVPPHASRAPPHDVGAVDKEHGTVDVIARAHPAISGMRCMAACAALSTTLPRHVRRKEKGRCQTLGDADPRAHEVDVCKRPRRVAVREGVRQAKHVARVEMIQKERKRLKQQLSHRKLSLCAMLRVTLTSIQPIVNARKEVRQHHPLCTQETFFNQKQKKKNQAEQKYGAMARTPVRDEICSRTHHPHVFETPALIHSFLERQIFEATQDAQELNAVRVFRRAGEDTTQDHAAQSGIHLRSVHHGDDRRRGVALRSEEANQEGRVSRVQSLDAFHVVGTIRTMRIV